MERITILKFISILQRNTNRYFDLMLEQDGIGSGQQFFLLRIYENQNITMLDLSKLGEFDKGTVTKAVQKLVEKGYVTVTTDPDDKRVRHLHTTPQAETLIERLYQLRNEWIDAVMYDQSPEQRQQIFDTFHRLAERSSGEIQKLIAERNEEGQNRTSSYDSVK